MKREPVQESIECSDVLRFILDLNELDMQVYRYLAADAERADELAEKIGKDRSTIHRSLQKLIACGLCKRERRLLGGGGHYYIYAAIPPDIVKETIKSCIDDWYNKMNYALKDFNNEFFK
ncbi:MAG: helix-turn-helix domain-containing protein [Thermoplasmata archaeon]|nr:helix-turn-helix domain-containing protein [Thermoplasmata archaeon]HHH78407.1 TrmB family transcriptional regulator [Thermoplasmatales archaeon]